MKASDWFVQHVLLVLVRTLIRPKAFFLDPEIEEKGLDRPYIIMVNHTSHLDGGVVSSVFWPAKIRNLAAKDRFEQKWFGFLLRHTGCIPIDRQNPDLSWVHESLKVLNVDRQCVGIYPEGAHGTFRHQIPFHPGAAMLAALADVPILMIYMDGPHKLLRKRTKLIVSKPFRLDPPTEGLNSDYITAQTEILQQKMKDLMKELVDRIKE